MMRSILVLVLAAVSPLPLLAQTPAPRPIPTESAPIAVESAPAAAAELTRARGDTRFKSALEIIQDNGEQIDLAGARTLSSRQAAGQREVVFKISGSAGRPPEFSRLVYLERPGEPPLVYFEGPTVTTERPSAVGAPKTQSENARIFGCLFKPWGPWQIVRTFCGYRFWCFFHGQRAIFVDETRSRQCPNGVQVQNRTVLLHCGC